MFENELFSIKIIQKIKGEEDYMEFIGKYEVLLASGKRATWAGLEKYYKKAG